MQGFGILTAGIVSIIVSSAFDHAYKAPPYSVDPQASLVPQADNDWRIILMFGLWSHPCCSFLFLANENAWDSSLHCAPSLPKMQNRQHWICLRCYKSVLNPRRTMSRKIQTCSASFDLFTKEFARRLGLHLLGTTTYLALIWHCLLQPKSLPKGYIQCNWVDSRGTNQCHWRTDLYNCKGTNTYSSVQPCSRLLVHGGIHRSYWKVSDSINGILFHDSIHVCPCNSLPSLDFETEQNRVCGIVLADIFFLQFWTQCHYLWCASRNFPSKAKVYLSWNISSSRKGWSYSRRL